MKLLNLNEFNFREKDLQDIFVAENNQDFEISESFDNFVNEGNFLTYLKSPIKATKLFNNAKKLEKALIAKAANGLDFQKKKDAAGDAKDTEALKQTKYVKQKALEDQISAVKDRMKAIASGETQLDRLSSLLQAKARVEANKKLITAADKEEAKILKVKVQRDQELINKISQEFREFEKDEKEKEKTSGSEKSAAEKKPETTDKRSREDKIKEIEADIAKTKENIQNWKRGIYFKKTQTASADAKKGEQLKAEMIALENKIKDAEAGIKEDEATLKELKG